MPSQTVTILYNLKDKASKGFKKLRIPILAVSSAITVAIVDFARLETKMVDVGNLFGATGEQVKALTSQIIDLSERVPLSVNDLASALFDVVSAGVAAGESINFLESAARLAVAGVTDTKTAVDGLTSIMNAYSLSASDAEMISDKFFAAQKIGKTTIAELSNSIGRLAPITAAAGLSIDEMFASVSALTLSGIKTDEAVTAMRATIVSVISPSEQAAELAKELGIEFNQQALAAQGLEGFLKNVIDATDGNIEKISELFPNIRALNGVLSLSSGEFSKVAIASKSLSESLGETARAVEKQFDTISSKFAILKNLVRGTALETTGFFEPVIKGTLNVLNAGIKSAKTFFTVMNLLDDELRIQRATKDIEEKESIVENQLTHNDEMIQIKSINDQAFIDLEVVKEEKLADIRDKAAQHEIITAKNISQALLSEEKERRKEKEETNKFILAIQIRAQKVANKMRLNDIEQEELRAGALKNLFMDIKDSKITNTNEGGRAVGQALKKFATKEIDIHTQTAIASALKLPIPINFITAALVAGMGAAAKSAVNSISFQDGGIVPGSSFSGDRISANVNSGEMVLNAEQQANLFELANNQTAGETEDTGDSEGSTGTFILVMEDGEELAKGIIHKQRELVRTGEID